MNKLFVSALQTAAMVILIIFLAGCGKIAPTSVETPVDEDRLLTEDGNNDTQDIPTPEAVPAEEITTEEDSLETAEDNPQTEGVQQDADEPDVVQLPADSGEGATEDVSLPLSVKGIYVSSNRAGSKQHIQDLIELCNTTLLNAMVIDVKTDDGFITFKNEIPIADEMGISVNNISDIRGLIEVLNENEIYPIARVVAFKDNSALKTKPELYIKNQDGSVWRDGSSMKSGWLNPYNRESWKYIVEIAKGAADVGFKEIQFDYIRFDTSSRLNNADFGDTEGLSRLEIIMEFARYAMDELKPLGVNVSADVYGTVINSDLDASIVGQDYIGLAMILDYICPMIYPSHYANGSMGIDVPDLQPYDTILKSLQLSAERYAGAQDGSDMAVVRPWLQDFTASWLKDYITYSGDERRDQIKAVYDAGYDEWLLWDAAVSYDADGIFEKEHELVGAELDR